LDILRGATLRGSCVVTRLAFVHRGPDVWDLAPALAETNRARGTRVDYGVFRL
jgi:hypothetical protein